MFCLEKKHMTSVEKIILFLVIVFCTFFTIRLVWIVYFRCHLRSCVSSAFVNIFCTGWNTGYFLLLHILCCTILQIQKSPFLIRYSYTFILQLVVLDIYCVNITMNILEWIRITTLTNDKNKWKVEDGCSHSNSCLHTIFQIRHDRFVPVLRHWFLLSHVLSIDMEWNYLHCQINLTSTFLFLIQSKQRSVMFNCKTLSPLSSLNICKKPCKIFAEGWLVFAFSSLLNKEMEFCPFSFFQCCHCEIVLQMIPTQIKMGITDGVFEFFSSIINDRACFLSVG